MARESSRYPILWHGPLRGAVQLAWHVSRLYHLAANGSERLGIVRLFALSLTARLTGSVSRQDTSIRLKGITYVVGPGTLEMYSLEEIYVDHVYDRVVDFMPQAGWTVFDLGANVGTFTALQASRGARVYAFEPNPHCCRRLAKMLTANRLEGVVTILDYAVGASPGRAIMCVPGGFTTWGSLSRIAELPSDQAFEVSITSLDHIVPLLGVARIDLLKIDVERAELDVLRGAMQTLGCVERIVLEYHSLDILEQALALLQSHGFAPVSRVKGGYTPRLGILYARRVAHEQK